MKGLRRITSLILCLILITFACPFTLFAGAVDLSNEYRLTVDGAYVYGVPSNTSVAEFMTTVYSSATIQSAEEVSLSNTSEQYVGTGMILCYPTVKYIIVVDGDVDGNGVVNSLDYVKIKLHIKKTSLSGAYLLAADVDRDGNVTTTDYLSIKSSIKKISDLYSNYYLTDDEKQSVVLKEPTDSSLENTASIHFDSDTITTNGNGVSVVDNYAYITEGGDYLVTGSSDNAYIYVSAPTTAKVMLRLSGLTLTNTSGPAIYVEQCDTAYINLTEGTVNTLADGTTTSLLDKGALFSNDSLEITGAGTLYVTGNRQHAIASDDNILISNGNVTVKNAVKDAFHANDDITVNGGSVTVQNSAADALESEGTLNINGGSLTLTCAAGNALKAAGILNITSGTVNVLSSDNAIKGDAEVNISGGDFELNCTNNAIKSDLLVDVSGGNITINSTGDGIKSYSADLTSATGETRCSFTYDSLNGSIENGGCYIWTTGALSSSAVYWHVVVAESDGLGGYSVTQTLSYGNAKTVSVPTDGILLLTYCDHSNYAATCTIQPGDTITYNSSSKTVTVTTPSNYLGDVNITGGQLHITCGTDAIQAGEDVLINNNSSPLTSSSGIGSGSYNLYIVSAGGYNASFDSTAGSYKALKGDDSVTVQAGYIYASTPEDTISSDDTININGGNITVLSGRDGVAAVNALNIKGSSLNVTTNGGYSTSVSSSDSNSYKALKGTGSISISGGTLNLNSCDDAVHSNGACTISGGNFTIKTGDDAFHSDTTMTISGGDITVSSSYEGVEGLNIYLTGGTTRITASDDGINAAGGADSSGTGNNGPVRPGSSSSGSTSKYSLNVSGNAYIWMNVKGDGLDSNGNLTIGGGTVVVQQSGGGNSGFDADGTRLINGGLVIIADGGDMVELPATSSGQYSVSYKRSSQLSANTLLTLKNSSGTTIFTFKPTISYKHLLISCPEFTGGSSYSLYTGGSHSGTLTDGLYSGGSFSGGSTLKSFSLSSKVTSVSG